jgi:hypothetical protein
VCRGKEDRVGKREKTKGSQSKNKGEQENKRKKTNIRGMHCVTIVSDRKLL